VQGVAMSELEVLQDDYDLSYRPDVGDTTFHRLDIVYRTLNDRGLPANLENFRGDLRRVVNAVEASGRVVETITWRNIARRVAEDGEHYGAPESFDWAKEIEYIFSAEDSHEDFFNWDIDKLPRDLNGWNVLLLAVDAHFEFDFLRSERHGAITKLRRIGDTVVAPDTDKPFAINFAPLIECPAFTKRNMRTTFVGLTVRNGHHCALLSFDMDPSPFDMKFGEVDMQVTSTFSGTLTVRLTDGVLEHGEFLEWVFNGAACISPVYEITRIEQEDFGV
jgi:hypothetical protein